MTDPMVTLLTALKIMLIAMIEFLIIFLCYWLIPIERRARFYSFITKRSYGVIEILGKGKKVTKHLANLFLDYATVRNGVFVLNPEFVYMKDGCPVIHYDEKDAFEPSKLSSGEEIKNILDKKALAQLPKQIKAALEFAGITELKKIIVGMPDIEKVYVKPIKLKKVRPKEKWRDPQMVKNIFMKQKALAESEAMVKTIRQLKILIYLAFAAGLLSLVMSYMNFDILSGGDVLKGLLGG